MKESIQMAALEIKALKALLVQKLHEELRDAESSEEILAKCEYKQDCNQISS